MYQRALLTLLAFFACAAVEAKDFEPLPLFHRHAKCWPDCVGKFCCDDYCAKPLPCFTYSKKNMLCDDYCRKPLPCASFSKRDFVCGDYCRKPQPPICHAGGKNLVCIPNRLPPIGRTKETHVTNSAAEVAPDRDARVEVLPISSRRMYDDPGVIKK